jgi:hypothetical protein
VIRRRVGDQKLYISLYQSDIHTVFDPLLSSLSPVANRHCITATDVEISTSQLIYIVEP